MKILFVYPSWTGEYGLIAHFARRAGVYPPLNLALVAAIAEEHGHKAQILDAEADRITMEKLIKKSIEAKPDIIALTGMSPFFHLVKDFASGVKERDDTIPIVVGGQHITIMKEEAFFPQFDFGFVGEVEDSWPEFLNLFDNGQDLSTVPGLIYRKDKKVISNKKGEPFNKSLDELPLPSRHLLDMSKYKQGTLHGRVNFTSIQTMRGCPWKCIFCASTALNTTNIRMRTARSVVDEMKLVVEQYNIRHFMIVDDVLTLYPKHILEICDIIIEEGLKITFEGSTRANLIKDPMIAKLKQAGLTRLSFGLETVDSEMRKTMNKKVPLEYYTRANKILNKYDVEALNSVMLGLPGETETTVRKTLDFLRNDRNVKQANFAIAVPYPGTEFHSMAVAGEHGIELKSKNFSEYRRYGSAVTQVNELTPQKLLDLQNEGFVSIYSAPWRWKPMLKKHGIVGGLLMLLRVLKLMIRKSTFGLAQPVMKHPHPSMD